MNNDTQTWLITGAAGFIGSHLTFDLLKKGQKVIGLDNFYSGHKKNLGEVLDNPNFTMIEGDIRDLQICKEASKGVTYILHHAAIGSVQKSIEDPIYVDNVNNAGFINILSAAKESNINRVIYASSSATYGNEKEIEQRSEGEVMSPLSPYAASKCANELYAYAHTTTQGIEAIGLRYFNIYGSRQDPNGAYAAVIPKWINAMLENEDISIYGDGKNIRDFCFVGDVVQANIQAAQCVYPNKGHVFNVATGNGISLNELFNMLKSITGYTKSPIYKPHRPGDIVRSRANIQKAKDCLDFIAKVKIEEGLEETVQWYRNQKNV